jgi:hypothetical protein
MFHAFLCNHKDQTYHTSSHDYFSKFNTGRHNLVVFLKLSAIVDHLIGGRHTRGSPSYQVNKKNIIPVVKVTITTFSIHYFKVFSKITIEGQEVTERTNSPTFC